MIDIDAMERLANAGVTHLSEVKALIAEVRALREALGSINVIRNSIIGLQTLNWSEHVYPLVAALDAAGFEGMDYPEAREFFGTMLGRCNAAEDDAERYRWLCDGNGYFLEEEQLCGYTNEKADADAAIDAVRGTK
jgi:hypothetical protein